MKKTNALFAVLAIAAAVLMPFRTSAQQSALPRQVAEQYPAATAADDLGVWSALKDSAGATLGYYAYSKPASDGIQGFNGETPLLVIFDKDQKIQSVVLLDNDETPGFVSRVRDGGLFDAWNGLTIDQALENQVDAVSGATFTSNGVKESLKACLQNIKANTASQGGGSSCAVWCVVGCVAIVLIVVCIVVVMRKRRKK